VRLDDPLFLSIDFVAITNKADTGVATLATIDIIVMPLSALTQLNPHDGGLDGLLCDPFEVHFAGDRVVFNILARQGTEGRFGQIIQPWALIAEVVSEHRVVRGSLVSARVAQVPGPVSFGPLRSRADRAHLDT